MIGTLNLCPRSLLSLVSVPLLLLLLLAPCAQGNTEIINFMATLAESPDIVLPWTQLNITNREASLNITPVLNSTEVWPQSGIWLTLDLDDPNWSSYNKFTLRASWPASHPCDIYIRTFDPQHVASQLLRNRPLHPTRRKYAHIHVINTGIPTPSSIGEDMTWLRREPVPVTLILEPLLLGVVPQSVVPVITLLSGAVAMMIMIMPTAVGYYNTITIPFKQGLLRRKQE
ncbi:hypothetical protein P691DRAFT_730784 [Macrolepiota fuliginosa MF-IS2]|uniref:Uncharacterized protein n=1 Tax=Macrolepiota fuliginosa MF-IS2 TaxID=1400762 RepID=A0A9P5XE15_9AGAR|nr:hypothetical protein P691DRAFT_730784 [Macrolepiota fuliginosa MF-IS2]